MVPRMCEFMSQDADIAELHAERDRYKADLAETVELLKWFVKAPKPKYLDSIELEARALLIRIEAQNGSSAPEGGMPMT
jgi:hypothetical protein